MLDSDSRTNLGLGVQTADRVAAVSSAADVVG